MEAWNGKMKDLTGQHNGFDEDGSDTSEVDVVNWEQLERELHSAKNTADGGVGCYKKPSKFLDTLTLREEIRRQLAEEDAKKNINGGPVHKSKSGFLDESSSSESDEDDYPDDAGELSNDASSSIDADDTAAEHKEFYLNQEFSAKIGLRKIDVTSNFRTQLHDSESGLNVNLFPNGKTLVVRPLQSRPSLKTRLNNQKDLQICFLNDFPVRTSTPSSGRSSTESNDRLAIGPTTAGHTSDGPSLLSKEFWSPPTEATTSRNVFQSSMYMPKSRSMFEMDTEKQRNDRIVMSQFEQAQAKWRHEMQLKIQLAHQQIHLQIQRQRRRQKKSPITTKILLPHGRTRLDRPFLTDMPVSHMQIILNDLLEQIENLNDVLVGLLEERDELHMEQDSKLVDIDDLSRRLQEQWMVNWKRRNMVHRNEAVGATKDTAENLIRTYDSGQRCFGRSRFVSHPEDAAETPSPEPAASTPFSQSSSSLNNFRQRIRSLLS